MTPPWPILATLCGGRVNRRGNPVVEQAIHLSRRDPEIGNCCFRIGQVHMVQSRTDEAIVWFEKARSAYPRHPQYHAYLASAYALKGDTERAAVELVEARRLSGDDRYSSIARLKATAIYLVPEALALFETTFFAGLRKAGMLEESSSVCRLRAAGVVGPTFYLAPWG
jgi:tetratricopeptide (TPR) repeat protein